MRIPYVPARSGPSMARVVVRPLDKEVRQDDNAVDIPIAVADRPLRIAAYEPRPSWSAGFVRRALEDDPAFAVSSLVPVSRGVNANAGGPPMRLTSEQLQPFDAIVVGAPEELGQQDVDALRVYARVRGGTVIFLPDRRPSGAFVTLVPCAGFDEVLLERPATLGAIEAGELARFAAARAGLDAAGHDAAAARQTGHPSGGPGRWANHLLACSTPGAIARGRRSVREILARRRWNSRTRRSAEADRRSHAGVVRPGDPVQRSSSARRTEFQRRLDLRSIFRRWLRRSARSGGCEPIRLWPTTEPGVFEGTYRAGPKGDSMCARPPARR